MQSEERGRLRYTVNPTASENEQESDEASHDDEQEYLCNMALTSNPREISMPACCQACWHNRDWIAGGTPAHGMYAQAARRKQQLSYLATTYITGLAIPTPKRIASLLGSAFSIIFGIMLMTMEQRTNYIIPECDPLCPSPSSKVQNNVQISYSITENIRIFHTVDHVILYFTKFWLAIQIFIPTFQWLLPDICVVRIPSAFC